MENVEKVEEVGRFGKEHTCVKRICIVNYYMFEYMSAVGENGEVKMVEFYFMSRVLMFVKNT